MIILNIPRPAPGTDENKIQIEFIEPLRMLGRIEVSSAYMFNLAQYQKGEECTWSPGFKYEFRFHNEEDATAFKLKFNGQEVI